MKEKSDLELDAKKIELQHFGTTSISKDKLDDFKKRLAIGKDFEIKYMCILIGDNLTIKLAKPKRQTYTLNQSDAEWLDKILLTFGPDKAAVTFPKFIQILKSKYTSEEFSKQLKSLIFNETK